MRILQTDQDRTIFQNTFVCKVSLRSVRASIAVVHVKRFYKGCQVSADLNAFYNKEMVHGL